MLRERDERAKEATAVREETGNPDRKHRHAYAAPERRIDELRIAAENDAKAGEDKIARANASVTAAHNRIAASEAELETEQARTASL